MLTQPLRVVQMKRFYRIQQMKYRDFYFFTGSSCARRSLTTAEAAMSPATEGTKEMVPGISCRVEHLRMLLPLGQMQD